MPKPAKSNLSLTDNSGISAVSPPINLHSDNLQPLKKYRLRFSSFFLNLIYQQQYNLKKIEA